MSHDEMTDWKNERDKSVLERLGAKINRSFKPKTANQAKYFRAIENKIVTICIGPAGTGKSYVACGFAARMLKEGKFDRVIITRPIVSCGQGYGFRPGTTEEKILPVMRPLLDALTEFLGGAELAKLMKEKIIEMLPLDDMRGCSLPRTLIICDESQNMEFNQLHMLLTRFGEGSKVIICGDISPTQTDLYSRNGNALMKAINSFEPQIHKDVEIIKLERKDIVRHPLIQWIDERLVDGPPKEVAHTWEHANCPECGAKMFFEMPGVKNEENGLVECWDCGNAVSLFHLDGELDPQISESNRDDLYLTFDKQG